MVNVKLIVGLVVLCLASAVAAFLLPNAIGMLLSFVSMGAAAAIAVLAVVAFVRLLTRRRAFWTRWTSARWRASCCVLAVVAFVRLLTRRRAF